MMPRSIRRAAERKAEKEARKAERLAAADHEVSEAQLHANRANAEKSTGARSKEGKLRIRHNAVRHGLTGQTVLLPSDDAALYENHCQSLCEELRPVSHREELLVQAIADHHWRLTRIFGLEAAIYAIGRDELADEFAGEDPARLEVQVFLAYEKQLRNLQLQQSRLTRYLDKDMAELKFLQKARLEEEKQQFEAAAALAAQAESAGRDFHPEEFGFVFSGADLKHSATPKAT